MDVTCLLPLICGCDVGLSVTITDYVGQFITRKPTRAGGVYEPGIVATPHDLEISRVIFHTEGHMISATQARTDKNVAQSTCSFM
jgi:hypothetical protein